MSTLLLAVGLVLALEGALYALFPSSLRSMVRQIDSVSDQTLRVGGIAALSLGVLLVWLVS